MLVGPPGSGKSSLMDRLLGRPKKKSYTSTGICDSIVTVNIEEVNPSTFHSVTVDHDTWNEVEYDESLLTQIQENLNSSQPHFEHEEEPRSPAVSVSPTLQYPTSPSTSDVVATKPAKPVTASSSSTTIKPPIKEVIRLVIRKHGGYKQFQKFLKRTFSLYLRDAGGQVEFQEMLPLLIFGPSIFFFVFRLDLDFKSKFSIEYRKSPSESVNHYTSSITIEEAFLQCLASVYAMDVCSEANVKTHKPLVFIVGTHKDKLGPSADERVAELNEHIGSLVENNGFSHLVQHADSSKGSVIFAVDNTCDSDEDFKFIRSKVSKLIRNRREFTIKYPISYLLFCLELQNMKRSVLTFDECKVMAAKYGIHDDQLYHLLEFLHFRIGIIRYFNKDGVRHIVIKEPQVLFNKVNNLIIQTFSCEAAFTTEEFHNFERKGILTASAFESVLGSEDNITPEDFLKILVHLHITAPFTLPEDISSEQRYFIPSVLNHVPEFSGAEQETKVMPLAIKFKCEHCPKGLFGVLVTHLMTPDNTADVNVTFTLMEDKIFKDQVSFAVHSLGVRDEMSLKAYSSHLEVKFFPEHSEDRDTTVATVCSNIRKILELSIKSSLEDLHYINSNVKPMMCFRCDICSELHQVEKGKQYKFYCKQSSTTRCIPEKGKCWYCEGKYMFV